MLQPWQLTNIKPDERGLLNLEDLIRALAPSRLKDLEFYSYQPVNLLLSFKKKIHDLKCQEVMFNFLLMF